MPKVKGQGDRWILGAYNPACLLSLAGVMAAIGAIIFSTRGIIPLALPSLVLAGLADLFDGVVARRLRLGEYEKAFGVQLDTVVDAVAFVAAPVVIGLNAGPASWPLLLGVAWFGIAGVVRLAHFNTLSMQGADQSTHHRGLPVTYTALIFPLVFLLTDVLRPEAFQLLLGSAFGLMGVLFVIDVPVRKPHGVFYVILPLLAVGLIVYWVGRYVRFFGGY